ncbi:MAG: hypothetical protein ACRDG7_03950 [Candidatus Limnocylindria bacterium]
MALSCVVGLRLLALQLTATDASAVRRFVAQLTDSVVQIGKLQGILEVDAARLPSFGMSCRGGKSPVRHEI